MMTALPLMLPAAPLPALAITTETVVSFEAVFANVAPTAINAEQRQLDTLGDPAADDIRTPEQVPVDDPEIDQPPVAEAVTTTPAPELTVAAQIIAAAAQVVPGPAKPTAAPELPQHRHLAFAKKTDALVRATSANAAPASAKPQNEQEPAETTANEIERVAQHVSSPPPNHRPAFEPTTFTLPSIAAPASIQPQIFHELDLARDLAWIGNLAQDIVAASDNRDHLSFRLMPRSLGQLDVDLSHSPDGLRVEMTASTERATQIIAAEQPRLIEELRQSGIKATCADLATGQHPGSQRGHPPPRADLPFFNTPTRSDKPTNRPDGRFA